MEYHSSVKKNKLLVHATIEIIVKNSMLSERSKTKKDDILHGSIHKTF